MESLRETVSPGRRTGFRIPLRATAPPSGDEASPTLRPCRSRYRAPHPGRSSRTLRPGPNGLWIRRRCRSCALAILIDDLEPVGRLGNAGGERPTPALGFTMRLGPDESETTVEAFDLGIAVAWYVFAHQRGRAHFPCVRCKSIDQDGLRSAADDSTA